MHAILESPPTALSNGANTIHQIANTYLSLNPLGVIDVNAQTGQVIPLTTDLLHNIRGCVRAAQRDQTLAAAA